VSRDDAADATLLALGTATLYEASKLPCALPNTIQAAWPGATVVGRALPVMTVDGDNLPLHLALEAAEPGDVLVVEAHAGGFGYWGEVMTVAALARGVRGLVINGCVRDIEPIRALGFPVFATGRSIVGTKKATLGHIGVPIRVGTAAVRLGDTVVGDADGVVCLPADQFDGVLEASRRRAAAEAGYMQRLRDGELTMDIYSLRSVGAPLADNGAS
jgi:4-hydroxy-4-methyl-2-oxoglutarate aldolase